MSKLKFCLVIWLVLLAGCAVKVNLNQYMLTGSAACSRYGCGSCYTVLLAEPTAQPGYDTDKMLYMKCPYNLMAFSKNKWIAPPHEMLTALLAQSLRNTCYFKAIVTVPFAGEAAYRVDTRLIKLHQEFLCRPSRVILSLQAVVIDSVCHQAIADKVFTIVVNAPVDNPYGGVLAANKAVRILLYRVATFVVCTIQQHPAIPLPSRYFKG